MRRERGGMRPGIGACGRVDGVARRGEHRGGGSRVVRDRCLDFLRAEPQAGEAHKLWPQDASLSQSMARRTSVRSCRQLPPFHDSLRATSCYGQCCRQRGVHAPRAWQVVKPLLDADSAESKRRRQLCAKPARGIARCNVQRRSRAVRDSPFTHTTS